VHHVSNRSSQVDRQKHNIFRPERVNEIKVKKDAVSLIEMGHDSFDELIVKGIIRPQEVLSLCYETVKAPPVFVTVVKGKDKTVDVLLGFGFSFSNEIDIPASQYNRKPGGKLRIGFSIRVQHLSKTAEHILIKLTAAVRIGCKNDAGVVVHVE
jgi:hypothetical protein